MRRFDCQPPGIGGRYLRLVVLNGGQRHSGMRAEVRLATPTRSDALESK